MYLDIVLIDTPTPDGILTTFRIIPTHASLVTDKLHDIHPEYKTGGEMDIGGIRIYDSKNCEINRIESSIRALQTNDSGEFSFQFEHMDVPIGAGGIYNLILPPGYRLIDFRIVDPYDTEHTDIHQKKQFEYKILWDRLCKIQLVEMQLRSRHGTFSFIVDGCAILVDVERINNYKYIDAEELNSGICNIYELNRLLGDEGKNTLVGQLANKWLKWLEFKPSFCGFSVNINEIIKDYIKNFKRR